MSLTGNLCIIRLGGVGEAIARPAACRRPGGKSELGRARWSLTATRSDPRDSATENIPPALSPRLWEGPVRVKWCGKSAPRRR